MEVDRVQKGDKGKGRGQTKDGKGGKERAKEASRLQEARTMARARAGKRKGQEFDWGVLDMWLPRPSGHAGE